MKFIHEIPQRHALQAPNTVCLYLEADSAVTYGQLWERVSDCSQWLQSEGVSRGHRVMVVAENCVEHIVLLFSCSLIGAWPVGVNARLTTAEIQRIAEHSLPSLIIFTSHCSGQAQQHAQHFQAQPCDSTVFPHPCHYTVYARNAAPEPTALAEQVATLVYTSGTTGSPKGVMVPHRGLIHFAGISAETRRLVASDIAYGALPISHIFGIATVLLATLHAGASLVLRARFDAHDVTRALTRPGITILQGVPTMFVRLLDTLAGKTVNAPALRYVYTGGAALDPALKEKVERAFALPMHHGYGITEYAGSMFVTPIDSPRQDTSAGFAVDGVELRIMKNGLAVTMPGEDGDIHIRGPGVMLGYYKDAHQTAQALLPDGWLHTGDIGHVNEEGALFLTGRSKDMIIRSGFNVYPLEVEAVINAFPGIRLSAVLGRRLNDGNEEVIAFYEAERPEQVNQQLLQEFIKARLAPYKRPSRLIHIESIPTTASGKIRKDPLRSLV